MTHSRRSFLQHGAGAAAITACGMPLFPRAARAANAFRIDPKFLITADTALDWNKFKASCGPTYAGSRGWTDYTDFF